MQVGHRLYQAEAEPAARNVAALRQSVKAIEDADALGSRYARPVIGDVADDARRVLAQIDGDACTREGALPQLAGVEDMKPGAEATLRLPLKPGRYAVFCNQPGHYKLGMVTDFTVSK